jgi:hypothetical protein
VGLLRRDPFRHLPPPPAAPDLIAGAPALRDVAAARLASFVYPDAAAMTRDAVWTVPAAAAGLQVIAGTIGTLPLERVNRATWETVVDEAGFLQQIDPQEATSATLIRLVEDLVLHPCAYLVVLSRYQTGYPMSARYVPYENVTPPDVLAAAELDTGAAGGAYRISVNWATFTVPAADVLRFPSPTPGLLTTGARALSTSLSLEAAARRMAAADLPSGAIKNKGPDLSDAKVTELLNGWETARRTRTTAYLNATLDFETIAVDAAALQLTEGREHQVAEIARLLNLPARYLNAPQAASLTYTTTEGQRRELVEISLRPYLATVEDRLSLNDVTPRSQQVRFHLDDFLRGEAQERATVAETRIRMGMTDPAFERARERIPGPPPTSPPAPTTDSSPNAGVTP